jgi:hypothetical protein
VPVSHAAAPSRPVKPGRVRFWTVSGSSDLVLECLRGETRITSGGGGWEREDRSEREPATWWKGHTGLTVEMDVTLEAEKVHDGLTTAEKVRILERIAGVGVGSGHAPPKLRFQANLTHHDYAQATQNRWVIGEHPSCTALLRDRDQSLRWAQYHLVLWIDEPVSVSTLAESEPFQTKLLHKGRTLKDFARVHLGDPRRWKDVQALNLDNPRCPTSPTAKARRDVRLLCPPREPVEKQRKTTRKKKH